MKKIIIILKASILTLLFIVVLLFTNKKQCQQLTNFDKKNIDLNKNQFINHDLILSLIEESNISIDSVPLDQFDFQELEQCLSKHPAIENVEVFADLEGNVGVNILERIPIVRVITESDDYYLDANAQRMPISQCYTPRVLIANGNVTEKDRRNISDFVNIINKSQFWRAQITQLYLIDNECILIPRVGDQKIHFGLLTNINEKLNNLYSFYKQAMPVKGWQSYSDINLKYNNQIVCTKK